MNQTTSLEPTSMNAKKVAKNTIVTVKNSLWQRFWQYQPSKKLARLIFYWWLLVAAITTVKMTEGFGVATLASLVTVSDALLSFCILLLILLLVFVLVDLLLLRSLSQTQNFRIRREFPKNVAIFHEFRVSVFLSVVSNNINGVLLGLLSLFRIRSFNIEFDDSFPEQLELNKQYTFSPIKNGINQSIMPIRISMPLVTDGVDAQAEQNTSVKHIQYPVLPIERGTGYFGLAWLRVISPMGLLRRKLTVSEENEQGDNYLRVLADFTGLLSNQLSAIFERSYDAGIQTLREQGQGSEFLKLREYAVGDTMRQIDWKASSRQNRLMSKSYEDENDQDVVFLLDCSEQMRHKEMQTSITDITSVVEASELSYFDKVLNAVLFLSYIANKQGDRVGLMTFGGANNGEEMFLPPQKGVSLIRHLLNKTADITPSMQTSDYFQAAQELKNALKKRSLVIVITNTRQEANNELIQAMKALSRGHQLVFANLTEQEIQNTLDQDVLPVNLDDSLLYHSLVSYQQMRDKLHRKLTQESGALCVSTTANKLPHILTQAYLTVKK